VDSALRRGSLQTQLQPHLVTMKLAAVIFASAIALALFSTCSGLQCYTCSTKNHTACEDKFDPARAKAAGFITECPEPTKADQRVLCRKTHQTVLEVVTVYRGCGYVDNNRTCTMSRNLEVIVESCVCFDDLCNSSGLAQLAPAVLLLTAALRAIF